MLSTDLNGEGFAEWIKLPATTFDANRELVLRIPKTKGVYVIRASRPIGRVKGESDIIYIGQGVLQHRIQALLKSFLPANFREYGTKHTARQAFERILNEPKTEFELSYLCTDKARNLESRLLQYYQLDHVEPPPLNNTRR